MNEFLINTISWLLALGYGYMITKMILKSLEFIFLKK